MTHSTEELLNLLKDKYLQSGDYLNTHLEGLLHAKPVTYWDYIQVNSILSAQTPRTNEPDEMVFIVYHQINELIFKIILW